MAGRWRMEESEEALTGAQQVEDLLDLPLLQRLAQQRAQEICILETDDTFEFIQVRQRTASALISHVSAGPDSARPRLRDPQDCAAHATSLDHILV